MKKALLLVPFLLAPFMSSCDKSEAMPMAAPAEVGYMEVKTESVDIQQELSGRVKASLTADVRPQVDGIIQEMLFKEGDFVKEGQVLYKLNSESYKAAYNQAVAALKNAEANITAAKMKSERYSELAKIDGVSAQEVDDANAGYQQALASVEEKKAALETATINLRRSDIKAPISGYIGISNFTKGALVTANQANALAVIRALDPVYVDLTQSSAQILRHRVMMEDNKIQSTSIDVKLKFEDGTEYKHEGKLQLHEISVDESVGSVTLRAEFPNPDNILLPGMYVRAVMKDATDNNAILVKQQAVTRDPKGNGVVMIVKNDNTVEKRSVEVGPAKEDKWIISGGLKAGERVIVEGLNKIREGMPVTPVNLAVDSGNASGLSAKQNDGGQNNG